MQALEQMTTAMSPNASVLNSKIDAAIAAFQSGSKSKAKSLLDGYNTEVQRLVRNGGLSATAAAPLVRLYSRIVATL
jgi:hypothetical protein